MIDSSLALSPPNRRPLYALLTANVVSLIGNTLAVVALPWFVLQTTGSAAQAGLVGFAQVLPGFIAGVLGGTLVDRFGYKPMSIVSDLIGGISVAMVPLLYHTVGLAFWQLLLLVFAGAILDIPGLTARRAMLPELAALGNVPLARANASFESLQHVSFLLGPPVAGLLIAAVGAANILWIDAASFLVSIVIVAAGIPSAARVVRHGTQRYKDELLAGLRFIWEDRVLRWMAIILATSNCLTGSMYAVILPVFIKSTTDSAADLGLLISAGGIGALIGATLYGSIGYRLSRRKIWLAAFTLSPLEFWILAVEPSIWWVVPVILLTGIATGPINPLMVTIRHERSPAEIRGRVFASYSAISMAATPLGMVVAGSLIEGIGFSPTLFALAIACQTLAIVMFFVPAFHRLEHTVAEPAQPEPVVVR